MKKTVLDIAKSVMGELSFTVPQSLLSSSDALNQQVKFLIIGACEELILAHDWEFLQKEFSIVLDGSEFYTLPTDLDRIISGSFYVENQVRTVVGSQTPAEFNQIKNSAAGGANIHVRVVGNRLQVYPTSATGTMKFVYISNNYIMNSAGTEFKNGFEQDSDIPMFYSRLIVAFTKLKLLQTKGLDTVAATVDFNDILDFAKNKDVPAPIAFFGKQEIPVQMVRMQ